MSNIGNIIILGKNYKGERMEVKIQSQTDSFKSILNISTSMKKQEVVEEFWKYLGIEKDKEVIFTIPNLSQYNKSEDIEKLTFTQMIEKKYWNENCFISFVDQNLTIRNRSTNISTKEVLDLHEPKDNKELPTYSDEFGSKNVEIEQSCEKLTNFKEEILPVILIEESYYKDCKKFLLKIKDYREYKNIEILNEKLLITKTVEKHRPKLIKKTKKQFYFFAEARKATTVMKIVEMKNLIKELKNKSKSFRNNFEQNCQKWVRCVFNLLTQFHLFKLDPNLKKRRELLRGGHEKFEPTYFYCENCRYPYLFISPSENDLDINLGLSTDEEAEKRRLLNKLNKEFEDQVLIGNSLLNFMEINFVCSDENIRKNEFNILFFGKEIYDNINYYQEIEDCISGSFIGCDNYDDFVKIFNEIKRQKTEKLKKVNEEINETENKKELNKLKQTKKDCENMYFEIIIDINLEKTDDILSYIEEKNEFELDRKKYLVLRNSCLFNEVKKTNFGYSYKTNDFNEVKKEFLCSNKYIKDKSTPFTLAKLVTLENYNRKYKRLHYIIAKHYGSCSLNSYSKAIGILEDCLDQNDNIHLDIKSDIKDKKKALIDSLKVFQKIENDKIDNYQQRITPYTKEKDSFYQDFNKWLRDLLEDAYNRIGYFIADLIYSINRLGDLTENSKEKITVKEEKTLYRGLKMNIIDLLKYKQNEGKIVSFPSFTSTSSKNEVAEKFANKYNKELLNPEKRKKLGLFSVTMTINHKFDKDWKASTFCIKEFSAIKKEDEHLILPFHFFKLLSIEINYNTYEAKMELDLLGKKEILEEELKNSKSNGKLENNSKIVYFDKNLAIKESEPPDETTEREDTSKLKKSKNQEDKISLGEKISCFFSENWKKLTNCLSKYFIIDSEKKGWCLCASIVSFLVIVLFIILMVLFLVILKDEEGRGNLITIKLKISNEDINVDTTILNKNCLDNKKESGYSIKIDNNNKLSTINNYKFGEARTYTIQIYFSNPDNITSISALFQNVNKMIFADLSKFSSPNLIDMEYLFSGCDLLEEVKFGNLKTAKVTTMTDIFSGCKKLKKVDLNNFNTKSLIKLNGFFRDCIGLEEINLYNFQLNKTKNLANMFEGCKNLKNVNLENLHGMEEQDIQSMFKGCQSLECINLKNYEFITGSKNGDILTDAKIPVNVVFDKSKNTGLFNEENIKEVLSCLFENSFNLHINLVSLLVLILII